MTAPFRKPRLVLPLPPQPTPWLLDDLLPAHDLVLLDGSSGVGKTALAAALAAKITRTPFTRPEHACRVVWFADDNVFQADAYPALYRHQYQEGCLLHVDVDRYDVEQRPGSPLMWDFLTHVENVCKQHRLRLVVLDGLEDHLHFLADLKPAEIRRFYRNLQAIARNHETCLLVLRTAGLHRPAQGGPLNRLGSEVAPVNLVLAWHPYHADERVLVVAKNKRGPAGRQHLIRLDHAGLLTHDPLPLAANVKPLTTTPLGIAPRPAHPNAIVPEVAEKILATLTAPMPAATLRAAITALGYTYTAFRKALRLTGARTLRRGDTWWYLLDHHSTESLTPLAIPGRVAGGEPSPLSPPGRGVGGEGESLLVSSSLIPSENPCHTPANFTTNDHYLTTPDAPAPLSPPGRGVGGEGDSLSTPSCLVPPSNLSANDHYLTTPEAPNTTHTPSTSPLAPVI